MKNTHQNNTPLENLKKSLFQDIKMPQYKPSTYLLFIITISVITTATVMGTMMYIVGGAKVRNAVTQNTQNIESSYQQEIQRSEQVAAQKIQELESKIALLEEERETNLKTQVHILDTQLNNLEEDVKNDFSRKISSIKEQVVLINNYLEEPNHTLVSKQETENETLRASAPQE